jgi:hypothetical protein
LCKDSGAKVIDLIILISFSCVGGLLYWMGGEKYGTLWRDAGVPALATLFMTVSGHWHWTLILCFGALWGALTTYNKWVGKLLFKRTDNEVHWECWLMTGFLYGLSMLPYAIGTGQYLPFCIRLALVSGLTLLVSQRIGKAWLEQSLRGVVILITLKVFLF